VRGRSMPAPHQAQTCQMNEVPAEVGPCHEPSGWSFVLGDRMRRNVIALVAAGIEFVRSTGVLDRLTVERSAIAKRSFEPRGWRRTISHVSDVLQHPKLPFVSYLYQSCFKALRNTALLPSKM
jgi:hypothetical protein